MVRRSGFSLLELLLAVVVFVVLTGLLLRTVHRVQEATAETRRLKSAEQVGLTVSPHDPPGQSAVVPHGRRAAR
jgi:prepilin-type N-terminal cleavage/methylation domain-containing protein